MKTAIGRSVFAGFAALCLLGALPTSSHATETEKSASDSARPDDFDTYVVMSNDAYIEKFGAKMAIAEGLPVSGVTPSVASGTAQGRSTVPDPTIPWHHIYWTAIDWDGHDIPSRRGNADFGVKHACSKHNACEKKVITAAYNGNADRHPRPTRYEYDAVVATSQGGIRLTVTSVAEQGTYGPGPTAPHTPDGRPIGTVTVFCRGQTVCPDWVNDL
ncbi:hypothetical protein J7E87_07285 [Streptomyces sp. ISL-1]|uniref:hypothetical protein n=1 Tax=Streptomyces sp. ISL-1 TaxID=2817657 RepID=UPI001BE9EBC3|nr:hypothetical protein [Streptomyces sp. ISL-1]MBT2389232.1 hypothetical protein [Streptomyces sp. ISL-1]